ncbi:MAG: AI-2E family transporter [Patescibacteria group bacterium]|nr:AI-2E family transporter [Patescibacteria group bacterium]
MKKEGDNIQISLTNGTLIRALVILAIAYAFIKLYVLILVVLTSIVIASFVSYAVNKLKPYIKNRTFSVFLIYIIAIAIIAGFSSIFIPTFISEMSILVEQLGKYIPDSSLLQTFQSDTISGAKDVVGTISDNASLGEVVVSIQELVRTLSGGFVDIFDKAFGGVFNLLLILIISFYLSLTQGGIENFLRVITPRKREEYIIGLWQRTEKKIGLWLQGQMLLGLIVGILAYLGLTLIGVEYSLVLSLLTAICLLIPFGIFLVLIIATIFAYIGGGVSMAILTFSLYLLLHQFENYLIAPLIVEKVVGISPLLVILSVLVGAHLAGFWGIVLAIPCAVALLEFVDDLEKKKKLT